MKLKEAQWQIVNALWQKHSAPARNIMDRLHELAHIKRGDLVMHGL